MKYDFISAQFLEIACFIQIPRSMYGHSKKKKKKKKKDISFKT